MKKLRMVHPNTAAIAVIVGASIAIAVGTVAGYGLGYDRGWMRALHVIQKGGGDTPSRVPSNFEECAQAGYRVMESYPRQCRTASGALFVETITDIRVPPIEPAPPAIPEPVEPRVGRISGGCAIGGCSAQVCGEAGEDLVSTCEFRPEYACYNSARCERQGNGQCGWTESAELTTCLLEAKE